MPMSSEEGGGAKEPLLEVSMVDGGVSYRPATGQEKTLFQAVRALVILGLVSEAFYTMFTYVTVKRGLHDLLGEHISDEIASIVSGITSAADLINNVGIVSPEGDALALLNMKRMDGLLNKVVTDTSSGSYERDPHKIAKQLFGGFICLVTFQSFVAGASASAVGIKDEAGAHIWSYVLMAVAMLGGVAYYSALNLGDVIELSSSYVFNFKQSSVAKLASSSVPLFLHATLAVMQYMLYRSVAFAFITEDTLEEIFGIHPKSELAIAMMGTSFFSQLIVSMFTGTAKLFEKFVPCAKYPNWKLANPGQTDYLKPAQRRVAFYKALPFGVSRTVMAGYAAYKLHESDTIPEWAMYAGGVVIGLIVAVHAISSEYRYRLHEARLAKYPTLKQLTQGGDTVSSDGMMGPSPGGYLLTTLLIINVVSQLTRTVQGVPFFEDKYSDYLGGQFTAVLLALCLGWDVNVLTQGTYFAGKLEKNIGDIREKLHYPCRLFSCNPADRMKNSMTATDDDSVSENPLSTKKAEEADNADDSIQSNGCCCPW